MSKSTSRISSADAGSAGRLLPSRQLVHREQRPQIVQRSVKNVLRDRVSEQFFDGAHIGLDSVRHRVRSRDVHNPAVHPVDVIVQCGGIRAAQGLCDNSTIHVAIEQMRGARYSSSRAPRCESTSARRSRRRGSAAWSSTSAFATPSAATCLPCLGRRLLRDSDGQRTR